MGKQLSPKQHAQAYQGQKRKGGGHFAKQLQECNCKTCKNRRAFWKDFFKK